MNKRSYFWNTTASTLNSAMSAILMLVVVRVLGVEQGGIFTLGYSIAQLMLTIGYYDMRAFQATDVSNVYSFGEYFYSRIVTCGAMMAVSVGYILIRGYSGEKFIVVLMLCVFKMTDAIEDIYHGQLQKLQHLDIAAFMQTLRLAVCMTVFSVMLVVRKDLLISCIVTTGVSVVLSTIPNIIVSKRYINRSDKADIRNVFGLLAACLPLCIGSYLSLYIGNAPKYAIDSYLSNAEQSYYSILFMPSYIINLFSGFILRPTVTTLANILETKNHRQFIERVIKLTVIIVSLTVCVMTVAYFAGIRILEIIYEVNIGEFRNSLMILLAGGGFYALGVLMYYVITIARKQKYMLAVYALVSVAAYVLSNRFVPVLGLQGAAISYLATTMMRFIGFLLVAVFIYKKNKDTMGGL